MEPPIGFTKRAGNRCVVDEELRDAIRTLVGTFLMRATAARARCMESYARTGEIQMAGAATYWNHSIAAYRQLLQSLSNSFRRPELIAISVAMRADPAGRLAQGTAFAERAIEGKDNVTELALGGTGYPGCPGDYWADIKGRLARADRERAEGRYSETDPQDADKRRRRASRSAHYQRGRESSEGGQPAQRRPNHGK